MKLNKTRLFGWAAVLTLLSSTGCGLQQKQAGVVKQDLAFYNVGHRGARGLAPENSVPGMKAGLNAGAGVLEFDLQVTRDGKVMLYHDKSINPDYTLHVNGSSIDPADRKRYTFYKMDYAAIKQFIIGEKKYANYPEQQLQATYIPLVSEIISSMESYAKANNFPAPFYMPEIKSNPKGYGIDQPEGKDFADKVMKAFEPWLPKLRNRLIIQCYDKEVLKFIHQKYPSVQLALLAATKLPSLDEHIRELGFKPDFYLPEYHLVTRELVAECKAKDIKIVPWTANELVDMHGLIDLGVNGIITDYPDRLKRIGK